MKRFFIIWICLSIVLNNVVLLASASGVPEAEESCIELYSVEFPDSNKCIISGKKIGSRTNTLTISVAENSGSISNWETQWYQGCSYNEETSFAKIVTDESYEGNASLYVKNSGSAFHIRPGLYTTIPKSVNISFFVKSADADLRNFKLEGGWDAGNSKQISELTGVETEKEGWLRYETTLTGIATQFGIWVQGTKEFYIDNFVITAVDSEKNLVINSGVDLPVYYSAEVQSDADGNFQTEFSHGGRKSILNISDGSECLWSGNVDFSGISSVFAGNSVYTPLYIACRYGRIILDGRHSGQSGARIAFKAVKKGEDPANPLSVATITQAVSDDNNRFRLEFLLEKGEYTAYIKGDGLEACQKDFDVKGICSLLDEGFLIVDSSNYKALKLKFSEYAEELLSLIEECENRGIATDYEKLTYSVITKFSEYFDNEAKHNDYSRMPRYYSQLTALYTEAKENLNAYLVGEKEALRVPKYVTSDVTLDGVSVRATTFDGVEEKEAPVFFVGYGHWDTPREEIPFFQSIGNNIIQVQGLGSIKKAETGRPLPENPTELDLIAAENGWYIDYSGFDRLKADLKRAAENNVLVSVNFGVGAVPSFVSDGDSTVNQGGGQFLTFNVDHPKVRNYVGLLARVVASELEGLDGLFDVCITNEPSVFTYNSSYFAVKWQEYLEDLYGTVENLKSVYGGSYTSFADVGMPQKLEATPRFYDWMKFNDYYFADFHNWIAGIMKDEAPTLPVQCKVMDYIHDYYYQDIMKGSDYERIAESMDVNGCDAFGYYNIEEQPLISKMAWYDFMTSVKRAPVWNTEDHITGDGNKNDMDWNEKIIYHTSADIWNGAVHGRGASVIWLWDKEDASMPWGTDSGWANTNQSSNFVMRPMEVAQIGKTAMDLNRLADEITAIQKKDAEVGILYSRTSLVYNDEHMELVSKAYESVLYNGQKVGFVTDSRPADMHKYKILIVPGATNVSAETMSNILKYIDDGGKLLVIGTSSLNKDEHNKAYSSSERTKVYNGSTRINSWSIKSGITNAIASSGISELMLVDSESGNKIDGVEWSYAKHNGKIVVNALSYEWDKIKNVKLIYKNSVVDNFNELREGKKYDGEIKIQPFTPILLEFRDPYAISVDLVDNNGAIIEKDIDSLKSGTVKLTSKTAGDRILALYKNDMLMSVSLNDFLEIPNNIDCEWYLEAMIWNMSNLKPLLNSLKIGR